MTSQAKGSTPTIAFVDARGGALSALAASVAKALGVNATAATTSTPASLPAEIPTVLEEVGMGAPVAAAAPWSEASREAGETIVFLGANPPSELAGKTAWEISLFEGAGDFERLAHARIARDRVERELEAMKSTSR